MRFDDDSTRLSGSGGMSRRGPGGLLGRLLSYAVVGVLLALALMFFTLVLAVLAVAALLGGGYLWWKMRTLRRQTTPGRPPDGADTREEPAGGYVIEGEVIRVSEEELPRKGNEY